MGILNSESKKTRITLMFKQCRIKVREPQVNMDELLAHCAAEPKCFLQVGHLHSYQSNLGWTAQGSIVNVMAGSGSSWSIHSAREAQTQDWSSRKKSEDGPFKLTHLYRKNDCHGELAGDGRQAQTQSYYWLWRCQSGEETGFEAYAFFLADLFPFVE